MPAPEERRYGGKSGAERRAERREKLLDAGLELFGDRGYAQTTIETLCATAGLNARYFYAEFESREGLLRAIYDRHVEGVFEAVSSAVAAAGGDGEDRGSGEAAGAEMVGAGDGAEAAAQAEGPTSVEATGGTAARERLEAGLGAFVEHTLADPRAARINYFEMVGVSAALEARRRAVLARYADLVAAQLDQLLEAGAEPPGGDLHLAAVALVSATDGLITDLLSRSEAVGRLPNPGERAQVIVALTELFAGAIVG